MSPRKSNTPLVAGAPKSLDQGLLAAVRRIWEGARTHAARTVNTAMVQANWLIGWQIVESQQAGEGRAGYGEELLKNLSSALRAEYGTGFSLTGLKYMRAFYLAYPNLIPISHAVRGLSQSGVRRSLPPLENRPYGPSGRCWHGAPRAGNWSSAGPGPPGDSDPYR